MAAAINNRATEIRFHVRTENCGIVHLIDNEVYHYASISASLGNDLCSNAFTNLADKTSFEPDKNTFSRQLDQSCIIDIEIAGRHYRLRYQSLPENDGGYDVTMRIQPQGQAGTVPSLEDLGFTPSSAAALRRVADNPKGGVYITGPMGQGKTTTLYSLMYVPKEERKQYVLTFEDPVEYRQYGVTRVPVGLIGYENAVKRTLRMGAHRVLIGEIRDYTMGGMVSVLSQTGPKVFTSLHVNGANKCIDRLCGTEIRIPRQTMCDPDMVAGFAYQRLLPKLCDKCSRPATAADLGADLIRDLDRLGVPLANMRLRNPAGCTNEDASPYCIRGRKGGQAVLEIVEPDEEYMRLMRNNLDLEAKDYWLGLCNSLITEDDVTGKPILANALYHVALGVLDVRDVEKQLGYLRTFRFRTTAQKLKAA
ncbi:ATPase, T2SS/T4P/T4SS family (plasmid) [Pseudoduganella sp. UC29_106]|uniref:ATPase, T2SS/T4P/T4SS family n=1 Tax=Pseudoduganella sp. UC29_106 TaxID=3374553 RepID=UPI003756CAB3